MLVPHLPFFQRKRSPGAWPWDDFRARQLPQEPAPLADQAEADAETTVREKASVRLLEGRRKNAAIAQDTVYQINVWVGGKLQALRTDYHAIYPGETLGKFLFVGNLTEPLLDELKAKYIMDPEYFQACTDMTVSQSIDKPSRETSTEDHIRFTLPFLRSSDKSSGTAWAGSAGDPFDQIDFDHLGIYFIRSELNSTIVTICSSFNTDTASSLCDIYHWVARTGEDIFRNDIKDPTFLIFPIAWYAVYAWSDALERLYSYLDTLESAILESPSVRLTQRFHAIRMHLLNYSTLLQDLRKAVDFVRSHPNPHNPLLFSGQASRAETGNLRFRDIDIHDAVFNIYDNASNFTFSDARLFNSTFNVVRTPEGDSERETHLRTDEQRYLKEQMMFELECKNLAAEIARLEESIASRNDRIRDVMNMVFSHVTITDSAAMKQIAWLTMFFIPATFVAGIFGMNVTGIGVGVTPLSSFIKTAVPFTVITIWILGALLPNTGAEKPLLQRLFWPLMFLVEGIRKLGPRRQRHAMTIV
ncbi:hypothetical protein LshimejAT787_0113020 [Lyophyllum shimeji]|uniref:Uncharacterized protein n=1 Tax=Lyophyllum shimeji TaxID=47721 RepID=A0A9P3UIH7_LYOSH|nr:hypothetical protein LshimejAT787_0113020 [Lyophyllum shimeji]